MKVWNLKKDASSRTRQHPWIYNSEIANSVKETVPGELIELRDGKDHFIAYGYGNPKSQISFRKLTGNAKETDVGSPAFFLRKLKAAMSARCESGWGAQSHRMVFAEGDGLPGLIMDYFVTDTTPVIVLQSSTAGIDALLPNIQTALQTLMRETEYRLIEASTSNSRKLEGLGPKERSVLKGDHGGLEKQTILLRGGEERSFSVKTDFLGGQKTGFFLDQQYNALILRSLLQNKVNKGDQLKMLDICCYVGQWSAHVADFAKIKQCSVEVHLVDASERALALARGNVAALGAEAHTHCVDVLESLPGGEFDIVVCDPPAFIKKKTDIERGGRAYEKLLMESLKRCKVGGTFVASSCSGLVDQELWQSILLSAMLRSNRSVRWLAEGGHGPDHPLRSEFREGRYLKCNIGTVEYPA